MRIKELFLPSRCWKWGGVLYDLLPKEKHNPRAKCFLIKICSKRTSVHVPKAVYFKALIKNSMFSGPYVTSDYVTRVLLVFSHLLVGFLRPNPCVIYIFSLHIIKKQAQNVLQNMSRHICSGNFTSTPLEDTLRSKDTSSVVVLISS